VFEDNCAICHEIMLSWSYTSTKHKSHAQYLFVPYNCVKCLFCTYVVFIEGSKNTFVKQCMCNCYACVICCCFVYLSYSSETWHCTLVLCTTLWAYLHVRSYIMHCRSAIRHDLEYIRFIIFINKEKIRKTRKIVYSECLLRLRVLCVFVLFCVFVFVWAILSWCPWTCHVYIVYSILSLNISSIYNIRFYKTY